MVQNEEEIFNILSIFVKYVYRIRNMQKHFQIFGPHCVWKEFVYATYVFELFVKTKGIALSKCQAMRGICLRKESKAH